MNIAVIFAGGVGLRMHSKDTPKQFLSLHGKPIIIHTLEHFQNCNRIDAIVISCVEGWIPYLRKLLEQYHMSKVREVVSGGETGQLSIYNGLTAAKRAAGEEKSVVLIHDGVRPLIDEKLITDNIDCVMQHGSAITACGVKETIAIVNETGMIETIQERANSRVAKAPQSFWLDDLLAAHNQAISEGKLNFIDSCTLMTHYGHLLHIVEGSYENIKITTPEDFYSMRAILDAKENAQIYGF